MSTLHPALGVTHHLSAAAKGLSHGAHVDAAIKISGPILGIPTAPSSGPSSGHPTTPVSTYKPPSPTSFLPNFQNYSVSGTKIPGNAFGEYSSFTVYGSSPSRGAYGIFSYTTRSEGSYDIYYYSIYTHNPYGSWGETFESSAAYTSPYAPNAYAVDPIH
jgi:hypothetical protein